MLMFSSGKTCRPLDRFIDDATIGCASILIIKGTPQLSFGIPTTAIMIVIVEGIVVDARMARARATRSKKDSAED